MEIDGRLRDAFTYLTQQSDDTDQTISPNKADRIVALRIAEKLFNSPVNYNERGKRWSSLKALQKIQQQTWH